MTNFLDPMEGEDNDADVDDMYLRFGSALGVSNKKEHDWFWYKLDITKKNDVVRVYWEGQLIFTELEDRFPSEVGLTKFRLVAMV